MHHRHLHTKKLFELFLALLLLTFIFYLGSQIGFASMIEFMKSHLLLGILVYFLYAIISNVVIFLPLVPLMPIVSYLYDFHIAMILTITGTLIGASICYFLARVYGKNFVIRIMGKHLFNEVEHLSQFHSNKSFLLIRLLGNNYYDLVSYMAGLSKLKYKNYIIITTFATLLWTTILFFLIEKTGGIENINSFLTLMAIYGALVLLGTFIWEIYHKKHLKK